MDLDVSSTDRIGCRWAQVLATNWATVLGNDRAIRLHMTAGKNPTARAEAARLVVLMFIFKPIGVLILAFAMSVLWLLGNAGQAHACSCVEPGSPSKELQAFDAVFAGRVISIQHPYGPNSNPFPPIYRRTIDFEVSAVWKGTVRQRTFLTTPPTGGSCGFSFVEGETYLVYASDSSYATEGYTVTICSRTALLQRAQTDIRAFGEGHAPQPGTSGPVPEEPQDVAVGGARLVALAVVVVIPVIGGVLVFLRVGRR